MVCSSPFGQGPAPGKATELYGLKEDVTHDLKMGT